MCVVIINVIMHVVTVTMRPGDTLGIHLSVNASYCKILLEMLALPGGQL